MRIVVFDTETTGFAKTSLMTPESLPLWPHIVQFSYAVYDDKWHDVIETRDFIVRVPDEVTIPEVCVSIHGITKERSLAEGVSLWSVFQEFFRKVEQADLVVGHNLQFDVNVVKAELRRLIGQLTNSVHVRACKNYFNSLSIPSKQYCTMRNTLHLCNLQKIDKVGRPYLKFPKLIELYQVLFHTTPNNLHNSLSDVLVTLRCFVKIWYNIDLLAKEESAFQDCLRQQAIHA